MQVDYRRPDQCRERGIDISAEYPKPWTDEVVRAADVVVTMGCGDAYPVFPGRRYEDCVLDDPAGLDIDDVRPIRDDLERRVRGYSPSSGCLLVADRSTPRRPREHPHPRATERTIR